MIISGQKRGQDVYFKRLKEAKQLFRQCQKEAERQYELKNMEEICKSQDIDEKYFWYFVNKCKRKCSTAHPIK